MLTSPTRAQAYWARILAAIPVYATIAFRTVYGGSLAVTVLKEAAIGLTYLRLASLAFLVTVYWVSVMA